MNTLRHISAKSAIALAVLSAVSFHATAASETTPPLELGLAAQESVENKMLANTINGTKSEWNADLLKRFDKTNKATTLVIKNGTLSVTEKGTLTNALDTKLEGVALQIDGSTFVNTGKLTLNNSSSLTIEAPVAFDNTKGTITSEGAVTIEDSGFTGEQKEAPAAIAMGDVTMKGDKGILTNKDKGYVLKKDDPAKARVTFGTLTLKEGAQYKLAKDALDAGKTLDIDKASKAEIAGSATWDNVTLEGGRDAKKKAIDLKAGSKLTADMLTLKEVAADTKDFSAYIEGATKDTLFVNGLALTSFTNNGSFTLKSGDIDDKMTLKQGANLVLGHVVEAKQTEGDSKVTVTDYNKGTVTVSDFAATYKKPETKPDAKPDGKAADPKPEEKPETKPESDKKPEAKPDLGTENGWSFRQFGEARVHHNAQLKLENNRSDSVTKDNYHSSVAFGKLAFVTNDVKAGYKVKFDTVKSDVESALKGIEGLKVPEGFADWKDLKALDEGLKKYAAGLTAEQRAALKAAVETKLDAHSDAKFEFTPVSTAHTISGSDVSIGTLEFKKETVNVAVTPADKPTEKPEGSQKDAPAATDKPADKPAEKPAADLDWGVSHAAGTHTLTINNSRVEVGTLTLDEGTLTVADDKSTVLVRKAGVINGNLNLQQGYLGLNTASQMKTHVGATVPKHATLELCGPVHLGETGVFTIGQAKSKADAETKPTADTGARLTFQGESTLRFDAAGFGNGALVTADGKQGLLTATGAKVNLEAENLSWGRYMLFENFKTEGVTDKTFQATEDALKANKLWAEQLKASGLGIKVETDKDGNVSIVVGSDSIKGSGLKVNAENLVSAIFKGDRGSALDLAVVNQLLSAGKSLDEVSANINAVTGLGAVSGVKALTYDFAAYTADQVEHHAVTMPLKSGGWWVQPLGAQLKSDDLGNGVDTYGYKLKVAGIMGGYDLALKDMTVGIAGSFQTGDADATGDAKVKTDTDSKAVHLWMGREYGDLRVTGMLSYVRSKGDATLSLLGGDFTSELDATAIAAGVRAERAFPMGGFTLTPHVGARAVMLKMDDYEIALGNKTLFNVEEDKATVFEVPVGVTMATPTFKVQTFTVQPYADVTIRGRFGDTNSSYTLKGSKTTDTIEYDVTGDFAADLKLGYMSTYKNLNLGMSYGLSAGDGGRQNHALEATIRVDF